ncbi:hypothetical protein [Romboutsia lituseburensis]|uniref:hypothetical protein n=1 Tax=Romboutsia lituseburensis TaxID=1537 RepID=UPI00215AF7B0|nr:hypothetical protein [Romboutsia lituseburensis]MCR8747063.1 signal peptide protein [Romboutsia lituseburensis]
MNNFNFKNAFPDTPQRFKNRVSMTLNNLPDKEENGEMENKIKTSKVSFRKKIVVTIATVMVLGTTALAGGKVFSILGSSSNIPTYTKIPTQEVMNNEFGFVPKSVEKFENGYEFKSGHIVNNEGLDEKGNTLSKSKDLDFVYKNGKEDITLSMEGKMIGENSEDMKVVDKYNGLELSYLSSTYKFVPSDYKMTEQDKKDEASGKYVFSVGSDKVEVNVFKFLSWEQDGIYYSFTAMDSKLDKDDLVKMAHEVIDAK